MKTIVFALASVTGWQLGVQAQLVPLSFSCSGTTSESAEVLAQEAVSEDGAVAAVAIDKLRALGPQGLEALLKGHAQEIELELAKGGSAVALRGAMAGGDLEDGSSRKLKACDTAGSKACATRCGWEGLKKAIDGVSGQCDGYASGLYWYTDFEQAKAAARAAGKPILSLRLLGKLSDEYSCANSRFFRTTLYANSEVSTYLREHFILHWQSVRPVPKLTIDFGDGRKLERTITGNSVHYVLAPQGQPVDALPGLYAAKAFLKTLAQAENAALTCARASEADRPVVLREYHLRSRAAIDRQLQADLARLEPGNLTLAVAGVGTIDLPPTARLAGKLAVSKSAVESPVLRLLQPKGGGSAPMRGELDDRTWGRLAVLHAEEAQLDAASSALIASKNSIAFQASELTLSKRLVEDPLLRTLRNLERSIAEDSVRNEFLLHRQIHDWFVQGIAPGQLAGLNAKVYAELFLMPENDPWLGLAPSETFTGLPGEGLMQVGQR